MSSRDVYSGPVSKSRESTNMDFGVRVGAVVERDGGILLVGHEKSGGDRYWVLPGGRLEPGETIPECAERELEEEAGLRGEFAGVVYVSEFLREGRHTVDITARVELTGEAEAKLGSDPETPPGAAPTLVELRWFSPRELGELDLRPPWIRDRLQQDITSGQPEYTVYLGAGSA